MFCLWRLSIDLSLLCVMWVDAFDKDELATNIVREDLNPTEDRLEEMVRDNTYKITKLEDRINGNIIFCSWFCLLCLSDLK